MNNEFNAEDTVKKAYKEEFEKLTNEPHPFCLSPEKISSQNYILTNLKTKTKRQDVRISLISLHKPNDIRVCQSNSINEGYKPAHPDDATLRKLSIYSQQSSEKLFKAYCKSIEHAIEKHKANIICINELGLPLNVINDKSQVREDAIEFTKKIVKKHKCLILAGSAHDHVTKLNTAYIFYNKCKDSYRLYHKQISAHSIRPQELITISPKRESYIINAFGLNIGFLLCLDMADYTTVTRIITYSNGINLILVPIHSTRHDFLKTLAKYISNSVFCYVGIINYYEGAGETPSYLYKYGTTRPVAAKNYRNNDKINFGIRTFLINPYKLNIDKNKLIDKYDILKKWLFNLSRPQLSMKQ